MTIFEESLAHEAAVRDAAAAVDAARAAGVDDSAAVLALEAAAAARDAFMRKLAKASNGDLDDYDPARAPGRQFWEGNSR